MAVAVAVVDVADSSAAGSGASVRAICMQAKRSMIQMQRALDRSRSSYIYLVAS
jgi:hypothetical protein